MSDRGEIYSLQDYATLDLVDEQSDESYPVAGLTSVEIIAQVSIETLYTADSIKPADKMQHEALVQVDIDHMFTDGDVQSEWLGGAGASGTSWEDTSDPQLFELTGEFESRDGSQVIEITVEGITFEESPMFIGSQGEYSEWSWSGEGMDITNYEVVTPA